MSHGGGTIERVDVVVAGAGLSGLTAAHRLRQRGASVLVLEAKERIGGRTWSKPLDAGGTVDRGAMYMVDDQREILTLVEELGAETYEGYTEGSMVAHLGGRREVLENGVPALAGAAMEEFKAALGKLAELADGVDPAAPWGHPDAPALDAQSLADWRDGMLADPAARRLFDHTICGWHATPPARVSLLYGLFQLATSGGVRRMLDEQRRTLRFADGAGTLAERLAAQLGDAVRCGLPVIEIDADAGGRAVVRTLGLTVEAERVIVALNAAATRAIRFRAPLSPGRQLMREVWDPGPLLKTNVVYERPFWREQGLSGGGFTDFGAAYGFLDGTPPGTEAGVLTVIGMVYPEGEEGANPAAYYADPESRRAATLEALAECFGPEAGRPLDYQETNWLQQPYYHGCQGAVPPGSLVEIGAAWREPAGRLHWAGTETARRWMGWMSGAVEAGERAAGEVAEVLA